MIYGFSMLTILYIFILKFTLTKFAKHSFLLINIVENNEFGSNKYRNIKNIKNKIVKICPNSAFKVLVL